MKFGLLMADLRGGRAQRGYVRGAAKAPTKAHGSEL